MGKMEINWQDYNFLMGFPYKVLPFPKSEDKTTKTFLHIYHLGENYFQKGRGGGCV